MSILDDRRECPECGQTVPVTDSWQLAWHYVDKRRCIGSGVEVWPPEARRNRRGSRWR